MHDVKFSKNKKEIMYIKQKSSCYYFGAGRAKKIQIHTYIPHTNKKRYFSSIKLVWYKFILLMT